MTTRIRLTVLACAAALAMLATMTTETAHAGPLPAGVYFIHCTAIGPSNGVKLTDLLGNHVANVYGYPCPKVGIVRILVTTTVMPPNLNPSDPDQWGGYTAQQLVDILKTAMVVPAVFDPPVNMNPYQPFETLPTLEFNVTALD